jgi:hypothetical protein
MSRGTILKTAVEVTAVWNVTPCKLGIKVPTFRKKPLFHVQVRRMRKSMQLPGDGSRRFLRNGGT